MRRVSGGAEEVRRGGGAGGGLEAEALESDARRAPELRAALDVEGGRATWAAAVWVF